MATEQRVSPQQLANGLGWFSIGLGLAEIATPNLVANLIGVTDDSKTRNVLRFYGARELAAGFGILSQSNPSGWLWARVAGDVADISSLCKAMTDDDNDRGKGIVTAAALIGVTLADVYCAKQLSNGAGNSQSRTSSTASITGSIIIARDRSEIYGFWRDFERLPQIFDRLDSVQTLGDRRSHWKLALPMGRTLEWDAEITEDRAEFANRLAVCIFLRAALRRGALRTCNGQSRNTGACRDPPRELRRQRGEIIRTCARAER